MAGKSDEQKAAEAAERVALKAEAARLKVEHAPNVSLAKLRALVADAVQTAEANAVEPDRPVPAHEGEPQPVDADGITATPVRYSEKTDTVWCPRCDHAYPSGQYAACPACKAANPLH